MSKASLQPQTVLEATQPWAATCGRSAPGVQLTPATPGTDRLARLAAAIRADARHNPADYVQRVNTKQHGE